MRQDASVAAQRPNRKQTRPEIPSAKRKQSGSHQEAVRKSKRTVEEKVEADLKKDPRRDE